MLNHPIVVVSFLIGLIISLLRGTTDRRPCFTSGDSLNTVAALTSARFLGCEMARPARIRTLGFRVSIAEADHARRTYGPTFRSSVVDHNPVSGFHLAQMFQRGRVRDAVPDRLAVSFEVLKRVLVGLALQKIGSM